MVLRQHGLATAINDFIQGIIMIFGIIAVIVAVLNGQGGFYEAVKSLVEIESDVITVANMFFKFIESPINAGAVAMVAGLIIVPIVSLFYT